MLKCFIKYRKKYVGLYHGTEAILLLLVAKSSTYVFINEHARVRLYVKQKYGKNGCSNSVENIHKIYAELYRHRLFVGVINGLYLVVGYHEMGSNLGILFLESVLRTGTCSTFYCRVAFYMFKYQAHLDFPFDDPINP